MDSRFTVAAAARLPHRLRTLIEELEPRVTIVANDDLVAPMRFHADFAGDPSFRRSAQQQREYDDMLVAADALYGIPDVSPAALARVVRSNPKLRWVQTMAAGGGGQVAAAGLTSDELARVTFTTSAGVHGAALAEFAIFGLFAGAKDLPRLGDYQQAKIWPDRWTMGQLERRTVLVLGLGGIGRQVAAKASALGMRVLGISRHGRAIENVDRIVHPDELHWALGQADAVVVTLPGTSSTTHLLDSTAFAALKRGATVVNVGRGTVIDEVALLDALEQGVVGFAALDVFEVEPLPATSALWHHPRVLVSPHTAALTDDEEESIARLFAENARRLLDGEPQLNVVDPIEFY